MGEHEIQPLPDRQHLRGFTQALLEDVQALERILNEGLIESGIRRLGAEQEMFLVDAAMRPANKVSEVLASLDDPHFTTELARFNLEVNLPPVLFGAGCLREMEDALDHFLGKARAAAESNGCSILLAGILPTVRPSDLTLDAMTPHPRYRMLNDMLLAECGGEFQMNIKGLDELRATHDNVLFEACNASFQVHFQVGHEEFPRLYNLAQTVTAPVLAAAVNSPVFLRRRLWKETRIALFEQSIDSRRGTHQARKMRPRVIFGDRWVRSSVLEIIRDDIARFRALLSLDRGESPLDMLDRGELPHLNALCLHNGTVWRWNRPCYGVSEGKAHLRIEHRLLPSGPTVIDEMANAAFYFGLMSSLDDEYGDITKVMDFDDASGNTTAAARYGLTARFHWVDGKAHAADELILGHLAPLARQGLASRGTSQEDIDRYLGVLEERVRRGRTGSQWVLDSLNALRGFGSSEERYHAVTASMHEQQRSGAPVHEWDTAALREKPDWRSSFQRVEQVMTSDLFTVGPDDPVELAASLMDWQHIRHVPVEDESGRLMGIISHRQLMRLLAQPREKNGTSLSARDVMRAECVHTSPHSSTLEAIELMRKHRVSCLPVLDEDRKLMGIISERDFVRVAAALFEDHLRASRPE